ncbi:MAG: sugar ABC transporter permease [Chloroflexi bacterium]|nr:sugar ABC transporter permease [Chloroflexota bacterium]
MAVELTQRGSIRVGGRQTRHLLPYAFVAPAVLLYFVFKLLPMIAGIYLAMLNWNGLDPAKFVGLQNFQRMFEDELVLKALWHNVQYAFGTVIGKIAFSLFLAILVNQGLKGQGFYRTALFMPVVMSFVVVSILWTWIYDTQFGIMNGLLRALGLGFVIQDWLGDPKVALRSLIVVDIWKWYGFHMVIFLAGLQNISAELYEAARIDGASRWAQFLHITLPLLAPVMLVNVTTSLMGGFNVFDIPFIMTEGGPAYATLVIALHIYIRGFKFYRFGYGAAMSYALLILVTIIAAVQMRLMARETGVS